MRVLLIGKNNNVKAREKSIINEIFEDCIIYDYLESENVFKKINLEMINIVYIELENDVQKGYKFGDYLFMKNPDIIIIYISSDISQSCEGYRHHAFRFVASFDFVEECYRCSMDAYNEYMNKVKKQSFSMSYKNRTYQMRISEILYCISYGNYVYFKYQNKEYKFRTSFKKYKEMLYKSGFYEIYRGTLVNLLFVHCLDMSQCLVCLTNGEKLTASKHSIRDLKIYMEKLSLI